MPNGIQFLQEQSDVQIEQANQSLVQGRLPHQQTIREQLQPLVVNAGQSTHAVSVHKSIADALKKLHERYVASINEEANIKSLIRYVQKIKPTDQLTALQCDAAKRFVQQDGRMMCLIKDKVKELHTGFEFRYIMALVWEALHDKASLSGTKKQALERFIIHFYEIQRGYNIKKMVKMMEASLMRCLFVP